MTLKTGDSLPEATFIKIGAEGPETVSTADIAAHGKAVVFALPGAFTGTCTSAHVPSFIRTKDALMEKGVEAIYCVAVNDPFVMAAWGESTGAAEAGIVMLADPASDFTKAAGLNFTAPPVGFYDRAQRCAMVVEGGTVTMINVEDNPGTCNLSAGETILDAL